MMKERRKIAIIGTSSGQKKIYEKAKEMGLYTIGFSWNKGCVPDDCFDRFYKISITEKDDLVEICRKESVIGVVTNGSELTVQVCSYVAEKLGLPCTPYESIMRLQNKAYVRSLVNDIPGLSEIDNYIYDGSAPEFLPCIVKPVTGCGKSGVSYAYDEHSFFEAVEYAERSTYVPILIEEYVGGKEISVESISFRGKHYVVQITDKDSSGAPHFIELGHHQPSLLTGDVQEKVKKIIVQVLDKVGYVSGASHIEMKITENGEIYLIEINPRGGGDEISNQLVFLSTGYDYVKSMIQVAVDEFEEPVCNWHKCSGIYFLTAQTADMVDFFKSAERQDWFVEGKVDSYYLKECVGNAYKNGYLIYQSENKIVPR